MHRRDSAGISALYSLLWPLYEFGSWGAGILVHKWILFFWKYRDAIASGAVGGWAFFVLRFSRLYPLHILTLAVVVGSSGDLPILNGYYFVYAHNDLGISSFRVQG